MTKYDGYSEGIRTWAMDAADQDADKAKELMDKLEAEVNSLLPRGGYISMETCEPVGADLAPEAWEELLAEVSNRIALEAQKQF